MNERIQELIVKSNGYWEHGDHNMPSTVCFQEEDLKKFAELLIEECAELAKHHVMNISTYRDAEFVARQIKQHFDAEEYNPNLKEKNK